MSVVIKTPTSTPFFDLQATLDGVTYTLEFRWNVRASAWFLNVLDEQATTIYLAGLRVVANWPLAAYVTGRPLPGALFALDTSGNGIDPGLDDFGEGARVKLIYFTKADLGL